MDQKLQNENEKKYALTDKFDMWEDHYRMLG